MDRRNFLRSLVGGVAVAAAARTFPFRVYGFPTEVLPVPLPTAYLTKEALRRLVEDLKSKNVLPFNGENFSAVIHPQYAKELKLYVYQSTLVDV